MRLYKLRAWAPDTDSFVEVQRTFDQIVEDPFRLNAMDIVYALLTELREQRGLEPLPKRENFIAGETNG